MLVLLVQLAQLLLDVGEVAVAAPGAAAGPLPLVRLRRLGTRRRRRLLLLLWRSDMASCWWPSSWPVRRHWEGWWCMSNGMRGLGSVCGDRLSDCCLQLLRVWMWVLCVVYRIVSQVQQRFVLRVEVAVPVRLRRCVISSRRSGHRNGRLRTRDNMRPTDTTRDGQRVERECSV